MTLYIATDLNVMVSYDLGGSWTALGSALPEVPVHDLAVHDGARRLYAFTHGRSAFRFDLPSPGTVTVNVALSRLWNLVSNPVTGTDSGLAALYPSAISAAYGYTPGGYATSPSLLTGSGYWVKFSTTPGQHAAISGTAVSVETVAVNAGWNLIGSITAPVPIGLVGSDPPGLVLSSFFGYDGSYSAADTIQPGAAYWVKSDAPGSLVLSSGTLAAPGRPTFRLSDELPPAPPSTPVATANPESFRLDEAYPNPFNRSTTIGYSLPSASRITVRIYDLQGRVAATLEDGVKGAGEWTVRWDASGCASGVYLVRLEAVPEAGTQASVATRKLVLMR